MTLRRWPRARRSASRAQRRPRSRDWPRRRARRSSVAPALRERPIDFRCPSRRLWRSKANSRRRGRARRRQFRPPRPASRLRAPLRGAALAAGSVSAWFRRAVVYGDDSLSSASRRCNFPLDDLRLAPRVTIDRAPVGPAETSFISSSTIASRSRFSRAPYIRDDPSEGNPPSSWRNLRKSPASSGVSAIAMRLAPSACNGSATSREMQT